MADKQNKLRISLLNVDSDLSPLKFKGWLRSEAMDIQAGAAEHDLIVIRIFLTDKIRLSMPAQKLDSILQDIANKMPNIFSIELVKTETSLTIEQMHDEAVIAQADLKEMVDELKNMKIEEPKKLH